MGIDYSRLRRTIADAITLAGAAAIVERKGIATGPDYAPVAGTPLRETVTAVAGPLKRAGNDGGLAGRTTATVTVAADAGQLPPTRGDRLLLPPGGVTVGDVAGEWFEIVDVETVAPGGVAVVWTLLVAR